MNTGNGELRNTLLENPEVLLVVPGGYIYFDRPARIWYVAVTVKWTT